MKQPINEIKKMQRLAGLITESEYQESLMNESPKILSKEREKSGVTGKSSTLYTVLLSKEKYKTPSGLEFTLEEIGYIDTGLLEPGERANVNNEDHYVYYQTKVYYKGKLLTGERGIPGGEKKAKKWLDKNGEKLIQGKGYQFKST